MYALGVATAGSGRNGASFETHSKYIEIQYTVSGCDFLGWSDKSACNPDDGACDSEKDIEFFTDRPRWRLPIAESRFTIFFPQGAHAPLGADEFVHKVVVTVAVNWGGALKFAEYLIRCWMK